MLGTRNISMSNIKQVRGLCPCAIQAKHNPNWKPGLCGCLGPDALYEDCAGDYEEYNRRSKLRHKEQMDRMMKQLKSREKRREEFVSTTGVKLTPEMMKDLTCTSWPGDSVLTAEMRKQIDKRLEELRDGVILMDLVDGQSSIK